MNRQVRSATKRSQHKNYGPYVKYACWIILVLSLIYAVMGPTTGTVPPAGSPIAIIVTVLAGVEICIIGAPWSKMSPEQKKKEKEMDRFIVGWLMFGFMLINAGIIVYKSFQPSDLVVEDSGYWIANRFLYLFGVAFFLPALVEPIMERDEFWRTLALWIASAVMFGGFYWAYRERLEPCHTSNMWYTKSMLVDDVCLSVAMGLFVSVLVVADRARRGKHH